MATLNLFPARVQFVDGNGLLTPEAYRALNLLFNRTGGPIGDFGEDVFAIFNNSNDVTITSSIDSIIQPVNSCAENSIHELIVQPSNENKNYVLMVSVNTQMSYQNRTLMATASGITLTLPKASQSNIGEEWTIILGANGYVDISASGADTINLPTSDTTIRIDNKGASVTLRMVSSTAWGIV